jgi:beta-galactosidase
MRLTPLIRAVLTTAASLAAASTPLAAADAAWIEGEAPVSMPTPAAASSVEHAAFLSEGKWLTVAVDPGEVDKKVPGDGLTIPYRFTNSAGGRRELWARIGFEFARSPFQWRLDGGAWTKVGRDELTCDLMELQTWCEAAWLKLADVDLAEGAHALDFEVLKSRDAKHQPERMLFGLDACCVADPGFQPNGRFKPGEEWRTGIDRAAAAQVFTLPAPAASAAQTSLSLAGTWEICRDDEQPLTDPALPIAALPQHPLWRGIAVPGDKNTQRPDLLMAHRVWYRARVDAPEIRKDASFRLVFPSNTLNTTVWVNGTPCGFGGNPLALTVIDVTPAMRQGRNEIMVGIRDAWYGRSWNPADPMTLRRTFNMPVSLFSQGFQTLAYPIWDQPASGILCTPELIVGGPVYTEDAFCIPSVAKHELAVELTLRNPGRVDLDGEALCEAVDDATGEVALAMRSAAFSAKAGAPLVLKVAAPWRDAKLWWPDQPALYRLRTTLKLGGKAVDVHEATFGFREWSSDGIDFKLNGVRWQGFNEQGNQPPSLEQWLADYRSHHYGFMRLWCSHGADLRWYGMEPTKALDWLDRHGVVVRRSGALDGESIGYYPIEPDPAMKKVHGGDLKQDLFDHWREHLVARVRGERNHPSVMIWSIENEFLYINCLNLYAHLMDRFEAEIAKASDAVRAVDPTRFTMTDGGGATKAGLMPVHGDHYTVAPFSRYPALAYEDNAGGGGRGRWRWDAQRPRFIGEELFAVGINPAYAYFGGEQVFLGKAGTRPAVGTAMRVISEGYRWRGIGACDFAQGANDSDGSQYDAWQPRVVLCRQWDWTFASGQKATRTFGIFNTSRFADPLTFTRSLSLGGKQVWTKSTEHALAPGAESKFDEELAFPEVAARSDGELVLSLSAKGQEVFRAVKAVSVLPTSPSPPTPAALAALGADRLYVCDPGGAAAAFLKERGIGFTAQDRLAPPPRPGCVWLIGKDALAAPDAASTVCAAYAVDGGRVIVLEQEHPLRYQAIAPAEMDTATNEGRIAFGEDFSHPLLQGLSDHDFFTWEPGEVVWRDAYRKPAHGAKSLIQCNESLTNSALSVVRLGKGVLVLSQLLVEEKLAVNAVPQQLLANMLSYAADYRLEFDPVATCVEPGLAKVLDEAGLQHSTAADPVGALSGAKVAVVSATPANLAALAAAAPEVERFTSAGGHLVLHGLTQEGLADFDRLVGVQHLLRPFRRERVALAALRDPLLAGVTQGDVALYSSEAIFSYQAGNYVASDTFSSIVDLDDVAPFAKLGNPFHYNLVNGMTSADGWKYICNHPASENAYTFTLPRAEQITAIEWIGNTLYNPTRRIEIIANGDEAGRRGIDVAPTNEPQRLALDPPLTGTVITVRHALFDDLPDKKHTIGCDNIALIAKRPDDFAQRVRPLLNIGGLVSYPRGAGGIVLCNLLFKDAESPAVNGVRKRAVLTTLLRNLKAPFAGGKTVVAGARLECQPIDLSKQANLYRTARGWFGDPKQTLEDLPAGRQTFAGVDYQVYEFPTSPVPTVVALGGVGVPDKLERSEPIPVGRKADALFFLHTAKLDLRRDEQQRKEGKRFEMARYLITWADGKTETVPVVAEVDIDDWRQATPAALPRAQLAWSHRYDGGKTSAAVWSMQWTNPRPDIEIASVTLAYGPDRRGVPVLIALTAASVP